jgi:hypothetical protein
VGALSESAEGFGDRDRCEFGPVDGEAPGDIAKSLSVVCVTARANSRGTTADFLSVRAARADQLVVRLGDLRERRGHRGLERTDDVDLCVGERRSGSRVSASTGSGLYAGKPNWSLLATITPR